MYAWPWRAKLLHQPLRHLPDQFDLQVFHDDARPVGYLDHRIERRDRAGSVDERLGSERSQHRATSSIQPPWIIAQRSFHEFAEQVTVRDAAVDATVDDRLEVELLANMFAARTEQGCMTGRSIVAAVDRGCLCGNVLELRMTDGAVFGSEIADRALRQVEGDVEIEEANDRVGD